jgi:Kef-type K+ transport system membrane component KefB
MNSHPMLIVLAIAVAAPLLAEIPVGVRLPVVVLEMVLGIIIGPQVLGLATAEGLLGWIGGELGLAALFFMAGMELDLERVRGRPLTLAIRGWVLSLVLGLVVAALLYVLPIVHSPMMVGLALSTTALGTLLPILRDAGQLETGFGRLVLAAGAVGEFGPVVMVSLVLTGQYSEMAENRAHADVRGDRLWGRPHRLGSAPAQSHRIAHAYDGVKQPASRASFPAVAGRLCRPVGELRF